jgi:hypothetical protein
LLTSSLPRVAPARPPTGPSYFRISCCVPMRTSASTSLDRHLFRHNDISTSTLLFPRSLGLRVPFPNEPDHGWHLLMWENVYHCTCVLGIGHRSRITEITKHHEWLKRFRRHMSGAAMAGLLASGVARRAKRQDRYRALMEIARMMRREGEPRSKHWLILTSIAVMPINLIDLLRRIWRA